MAKKHNTKKKVVEVKAEKAIIETPKNKSIDWNTINGDVIIIGLGGKHLAKGQEYKVTKATAKILVGKGDAKLK